ncbi:cytochrome P450 [Saccharata proteae CBS 121410]|uniref:Cytochrome P450 n=1 Tax=Saccharata proteae CBS 121410 TaxID=1314787 RepID=A0A9P4HWL8_9PEZI|nr:cytochrome P450 [Saccharata proteae CBS 121410]
MAIVYILGACIALVVFHLLRNFFRPGLSSIPGPWPAKFTRMHRTFEMARNNHLTWVMNLHRKHGDYVRIAPNLVSIADPLLIDRIFSTNQDFLKADYMVPFEKVVDGKTVHGMVDTQDRLEHRAKRQPVSSTYAMSNIIAFEPRVDDTIRCLIKRLDDEFVRTSKACDINHWMQYFAFDVIGEVTLSHRVGFLDAGYDINDMLNWIEKISDYRAISGCAPWTHRFIMGNAILRRVAPSDPFIQRSTRLFRERMAAEKMPTEKKEDMISHFAEIKRKHPEVPDHVVIQWVYTNFLAGSDTTSVVLRACMYYMARYPAMQKRLQDELDAEVATYPVTWKCVQKLPYVNAFISEIMRYQPLGGFMIERVVPEQGLELSNGQRLPGGTNIGVNAGPMHRNKRAFGEDAEVFRPERWLRMDGETQENFDNRIRTMKKADIFFSKGPRVCLGIHLAKLEIYKVVPTLVGLFDIELADPTKEMKYAERFFCKQYDMDVILRWRNNADVSALQLETVVPITELGVI